MGDVVTLNLKVDDYSNRVLGVIKAKFGFKDKSQALNKLVDLYGEEFVDKEVKDEVIKDMLKSCNEHIKKYGLRKMTIAELDKLCGV